MNINYESLSSLTFFRGRVALYAILKALDIGSHDEVAIQAFTCVAVPEAIMATGAKPLYIDIGFKSVNMNPQDLAKKISDQTRAIVVQHTFGIPADMDTIIELAKEKQIPVIEDCCHTLVSTYKGEKVGNFGVGSFYSFEWGKPVIAGIGGSAKVNDKDLFLKVEELYGELSYPSLARQLRLRLQYIMYDFIYRPKAYWKVKSVYHKLGILGLAEGNYNPVKTANVAASDFGLKMAKHTHTLLIDKLNNVNQYAKYSRWVTSQYKSLIRSDEVCHLEIDRFNEVVYVRYPLIAKNKTRLLQKAYENNIELADWYATPIHPLQNSDWNFVHYEPYSCPNAEMMSQNIVTLPVNNRVTSNDIRKTVKFLNEVKL